MQDSLIIRLIELEEFGQQFSGEIDAAIYQLKALDADSASNLNYDLFVQRFDSELLVTGKLNTQFQLQCVRTLHPFQKTISIKDFQQSFEIKEEVVDLTQTLREEILLQLPVYPTCDMADEPMQCEVEEKYLALDKDQEGSVKDQSAKAEDDRWSALDSLGDLNT